MALPSETRDCVFMTCLLFMTSGALSLKACHMGGTQAFSPYNSSVGLFLNLHVRRLSSRNVTWLGWTSSKSLMSGFSCLPPFSLIVKELGKWWHMRLGIAKKWLQFSKGWYWNNLGKKTVVNKPFHSSFVLESYSLYFLKCSFCCIFSARQGPAEHLDPRTWCLELTLTIPV